MLVHLRHFSWTETRRDGSEFVNESGMLFVFEAIPNLSLGRERRLVVETGLEMYFGFFVQGGVRAGYTVSRDFRLDAMLGLKVPLSISENVDQSREGNGEHTLNPGISPRLSLELGAGFARFHAALTFDRWTLAESPNTSVVLNGQTVVVSQPDSTRTLLGFKIGYLL